MRLAPTAFSACVPSSWATLALVAWFGAPGCASGEPVADAIQFARGTSSAEVHGAVVRGERVLYTLEARGGQQLTLDIVAPENNAVFQVYAPGARPEMRDFGLAVVGQALSGAGEGDDATRWTGSLPRSGAYLVVVGATRGNASYRLMVTIR